MKDLKLCPYCLTPLQAGSRQCANCAGSTANDPAVEMSERAYATASRKPCIVCGVPILNVASVCFACGRRQSAPAALLYDSARCFYLVPVEAELKDGPVLLRDIDGAAHSASPDALEPFACSAGVARAYLAREFDAALKRAGNTFRRLKTFDALIAGESAGSSGEEAEASFHRLMGALTGQATGVPDELLRAIEALNAAGPDGGKVPAELASLFSQDEQAGILGTVMARLRDIAGKLDATVLTENDHPAGWVEVLYRELFADEAAGAKTRQKKRIRSAVSQSIADGLRQRGVTPSADFKREDTE